MKNDKRIKYIKLEINLGAAVSRKTGIKSAEGRFIAFIDSDDIWLPKKLEKQVKYVLDKNIYLHLLLIDI